MSLVSNEVDLSRFDAAPLIAFTAAKETNYGHRKSFYLIWAQPIQGADLGKTHMVAERHFNDVAKDRGIKLVVFHMAKAGFVAHQVKRPMPLARLSNTSRSTWA